MFIPAISFLRPESINYAAYYTIIITISAVFILLKETEFKVDSIIIFFVWYIINIIFIRGIFNILIYYSFFIVPLTSVSLYIFFISIKSEFQNAIISFFLKWLMIAVVLESLIGISQSFFSFPIFPNILGTLYTYSRNYLAYIFPSLSPQVTQGSGTFEHFNGLGGLLSLTFPIFFGFWYSNKKKILRIILMIITFLGLITTYSRGALIGVIFAFSFFFLFFSKFSRKKKFAISLFLIFILIAFLSNDIENYYYSTQNFTIRMDTWKIALNYAANNPLKLIFGYGVFFFRDNILGFKNIPQNIHSGQLEIFLELGIVGFILFCKFYFQIIIQALKFRNNIVILSFSAGLISFFIHQLVENSFFGFLGILMACLLGLLKSLMKSDNRVIVNWWTETK